MLAIDKLVPAKQAAVASLEPTQRSLRCHAMHRNTRTPSQLEKPTPVVKVEAANRAVDLDSLHASKNDTAIDGYSRHPRGA